ARIGVERKRVVVIDHDAVVVVATLEHLVIKACRPKHQQVRPPLIAVCIALGVESFCELVVNDGRAVQRVHLPDERHRPGFRRNDHLSFELTDVRDGDFLVQRELKHPSVNASLADLAALRILKEPMERPAGEHLRARLLLTSEPSDQLVQLRGLAREPVEIAVQVRRRNSDHAAFASAAENLPVFLSNWNPFDLATLFRSRLMLSRTRSSSSCVCGISALKSSAVLASSIFAFQSASMLATSF